MAFAKITYDPEMRAGEHGRRLYAYWKKIRHNTDSDGIMAWKRSTPRRRKPCLNTD